MADGLCRIDIRSVMGHWKLPLGTTAVLQNHSFGLLFMLRVLDRVHIYTTIHGYIPPALPMLLRGPDHRGICYDFHLIVVRISMLFLGTCQVQFDSDICPQWEQAQLTSSETMRLLLLINSPKANLSLHKFHFRPLVVTY